MNEEPEQWRMFCAIGIPGPIRAQVTEHIAMLRQALPAALVSWSREESIHLTLKFLGDIPKTGVQALSQAASGAVEGLAPFEIVVAETGVFPKRGAPRVLWIGINDSAGRLGALYARLEQECAKAGFARAERPFHPHLTLARLRNLQGARALASAHRDLGFEPVAAKVSEVLVMRSELSSEGSKHTVISRHSLIPGTRKG